MIIPLAKVEGIVECFHNKTYQYNCHKWTSLYCANEEVSNQMREALGKSHEYMEENKVKFHVVDLTNSKDTFSIEDQEWINTKAIPREQAAGIKYFITILSEDFYSTLSMEDWQEETRDLMTYINVKTLEEAEKWIQSKQEELNP